PPDWLSIVAGAATLESMPISRFERGELFSHAAKSTMQMKDKKKVFIRIDLIQKIKTNNVI
ncbi:MAG: hypothetical protein WBB31_11195, partial [Saprospiraceae bacterium]